MRYFRRFESGVECSDNQVTTVRNKDKDEDECWIAARQWVPRCQVGATASSLCEASLHASIAVRKIFSHPSLLPLMSLRRTSENFRDSSKL
jgi:hypothetical protein